MASVTVCVCVCVCVCVLSRDIRSFVVGAQLADRHNDAGRRDTELHCSTLVLEQPAGC